MACDVGIGSSTLIKSNLGFWLDAIFSLLDGSGAALHGEVLP